MRCLITGGAGFVGSSLAIRMKNEYPEAKVIAFDNLRRRGSELNIPRLCQYGIEFVHGDIRNKEDLNTVGPVDALIECSAEPSVLAGYNSSPEYLINTNLLGTVNCLEFARTCKACLIMLSTSRVYPFETINSLKYYSTATRYELKKQQIVQGCSPAGVTEDFPLVGLRSLYGATKLASELLITEYSHMYGIKCIINRCGVLTGPWQFGKIDQGFVVLWVAKHFWNQKLSYIGFGGEGKQVRDILHVDDLFRLIDIQLSRIEELNGTVFNVGGGREISVSLRELTWLCEKYTGNQISIKKEEEPRPLDIRIYLTDNSKVNRMTNWVPEKSVENIIEEISIWVKENDSILEGVLK